MPNRIIRDGIISSSRINALSFGAEVLYRRLMSVADDYGRYYGTPTVIRGACWPTAPKKVKESDVTRWLAELTKSDPPLVRLYDVSGCRFLEITDFGQQIRSKSKFPQYDSNLLSTCNQSDSTSRSRISESETKAESSLSADANFEIFWRAYPRHDGGPSKAKECFLKHPKLWTDPLFFESVMRSLELFKACYDWTKQDGQFVPHATTWLNQKRWEGNARGNTTGSNGSAGAVAEATRGSGDKWQRELELEQEREARRRGTAGES